MPVSVQYDDELDFPLTAAQVDALWRATRAERDVPDDIITIRCVDETEIRRLKREYLERDEPTNVLTFSYGDGTHDVALCLAVAEREGLARGTERGVYAALLLVHAFLHAAGMDHAAAGDRQAMRMAEERVLAAAGFTAQSLLAKR